MSRSEIKDKSNPPKKDFVVGKWYKCVDSKTATTALTEGEFYECTWVSSDSGSIGVNSNTMKDSRGWTADRFDINSELDYDPNTVTFNVGDKVEVTSNMGNGNEKKPTFLTSWLIGDIVTIIAVCRNGKYASFKCNKEGCDYSQELSQYQLKKVVDTVVKESKIDVVVTGYDLSVGKDLSVVITRSSETNNFKPNDFSITREDVNMSNQRKVVEVQLFDDAKGLPVQDSLVAKFENVLTEDDNDTTIREVIMNNDIKKVLASHNVKRSKVINQDILERTGNSVPLQPVLLKDLRWKVIG